MNLTNSLLSLLAQGSETDLFKLILTSNLIVKLVLILLLVFSVFSWAIIFKKYLLLRRLKKDSESFIRIFRKSKRFSEISSACESLRNTPLVEVFLSGYEELEVVFAASSTSKNPTSTASPQVPYFENRECD